MQKLIFPNTASQDWSTGAMIVMQYVTVQYLHSGY